MTDVKTPEILLKVNNVCFSYRAGLSDKSHVVRNISFDMLKGEFLCLLGPSGCGKTSLLRLIAGLEKPDSGLVSAGCDKQEMPKVGMVFQDLALFPHMSAARNIGYALRHLPRHRRRSRIDDMLELVGLSDKRAAYPHELSGGQKQRLALARALAREPDLILLDEPFAAQDINLRAQMRDDVMRILRAAGVAAILVTHDPEEAMQFADRLAIMRAGKIQQIGTPSDIYNKPNSADVASFFGQVNKLKGRVKDGQITTPLGQIKAPDFSDNTDVEIIIRPEALKISAHDPSFDHQQAHHIHAHAIVADRKYLGRSTLVHMNTHDVDQDNKTEFHIQARVPGAFSVQSSDLQDIFLDPSQIFVFKDEVA